MSTIPRRKNIAQIFFQDNVQKLLKDITRFDQSKVFARRQVENLRSPLMIFMSDKQLEVAKEAAYKNAEGRLQMPPIMEADTSEPVILSKDEDIVGYTKFKISFVDISPGHSNRTRLMSIREPDGTLRYPTHKERSRLNHIFYPGEYKCIDVPKMFEEDNLSKLLEKREYLYILDRACLQFEPDDPDYVAIISKVYDHIDVKKDYHLLRSTRHFGPLSLYLAYNKKANGLLVEMITKGLKEDAVKLVKIFNECHDVVVDEKSSDETILAVYMEEHGLSN